MLILAIETTGPHGGIAAVEDGRILGEINLSGKETYSQRLFISIDWLFERLGIGWSQIGLIAASIGPGSFTGIRIGLSAAKGFSLGRDIPIMGIPTLDALAGNVCLPDGQLLFPVLDAKRSQIYTALYQFTCMRPQRSSPYQAIDPEDLVHIIPEKNNVFLLGEGAFIYKDIISGALGNRAVFLSPYMSSLRAASVGIEAEHRLKAGKDTDDPRTLGPIYVRLPDAEEKKKKISGLQLA